MILFPAGTGSHPLSPMLCLGWAHLLLPATPWPAGPLSPLSSGHMPPIPPFFPRGFPSALVLHAGTPPTADRSASGPGLSQCMAGSWGCLAGPCRVSKPIRKWPGYSTVPTPALVPSRGLHGGGGLPLAPNVLGKDTNLGWGLSPRVDWLHVRACM